MTLYPVEFIYHNIQLTTYVPKWAYKDKVGLPLYLINYQNNWKLK